MKIASIRKYLLLPERQSGKRRNMVMSKKNERSASEPRTNGRRSILVAMVSAQLFSFSPETYLLGWVMSAYAICPVDINWSNIWLCSACRYSVMSKKSLKLSPFSSVKIVSNGGGGT